VGQEVKAEVVAKEGAEAGSGWAARVEAGLLEEETG